MTTTVYLSGPISNMPYAGATDWREALTSILHNNGFRVLDPMRGKSFLSNQRRIEREVYEGLHNPVLSDKALVNRDHADVTEADIIIANLLPIAQGGGDGPAGQRVSIGTMFELAWAMHMRKIVVIVIDPESSHNHPFVREAGVVFERLDEAVQYVLSCKVPDYDADTADRARAMNAGVFR
jgi:nucleoside 2-deoxyribosyltransferase